MKRLTTIVLSIAILGTVTYTACGWVRNNFVYLPAVTSFESHDGNLQLYTANGEGYYLELEEVH